MADDPRLLGADNTMNATTQPSAGNAAAEQAVPDVALLRQYVEQGDREAIFGAFKEVGDACKGCHDDFRKE